MRDKRKSKEQRRQEYADSFLKRVEIIFADKHYDFSKVRYETCDAKVIVICPKHGEFEATPSSLLAGHGCPICGNRGYGKGKDAWIKRAKEKFPQFGYEHTDYMFKTTSRSKPSSYVSRNFRNENIFVVKNLAS